MPAKESAVREAFSSENDSLRYSGTLRAAAVAVVEGHLKRPTKIIAGNRALTIEVRC